MTSHAAVVARGMGKPCVSGCQSIEVDARKETVTLPDGKVLKRGDVVTIDGATGEVMLGSVPLVRSTSDADFQQVGRSVRGRVGGGWMGGRTRLDMPGSSSQFTLLLQMLAWADEVRTLKVKANADTPEDAKKARELGAEGIGLCRTEHMFFDPARCVRCRHVCGLLCHTIHS